MIIDITRHENGHLWEGTCQECGARIAAHMDGFGRHACLALTAQGEEKDRELWHDDSRDPDEAPREEPDNEDHHWRAP